MDIALPLAGPGAPHPGGAAPFRPSTRWEFLKSAHFLELDFQTETLELLDEHVEGLRRAGLGRVLALHDRLVDARPARDVVGLHREEFLQRVGRAVRLERPHFHLTEALAAELRLAAQ